MPTKSPTEELLDQIDAIVKGKTFSLEAVGAVEQLRETAKNANTKIVDLEAKISCLAHDAAKHLKELETQGIQLTAWVKRESELLAREAKMVDLEKSEAKAIARLEGYREMAGLFLANPTRRYQGNKTLSHSLSGPQGYSTSTDTQSIDHKETNE